MSCPQSRDATEERKKCLLACGGLPPLWQVAAPPPPHAASAHHQHPGTGDLLVKLRVKGDRARREIPPPHEVAGLLRTVTAVHPGVFRFDRERALIMDVVERHDDLKLSCQMVLDCPLRQPRIDMPPVY